MMMIALGVIHQIMRKLRSLLPHPLLAALVFLVHKFGFFVVHRQRFERLVSLAFAYLQNH